MVDAGVLEDVLWHIHNWFERESIEASGCAIEDGALPASIADSLLYGQWYRIEVSYLNDGLHQHPATDLNDEVFDGTSSKLAIPSAVINLADEIGEWRDAYEASALKALEGPYSSESFGGYTYSLRDDGTAQGASGGLTGWQAMFASRLNPWRKIS